MNETLLSPQIRFGKESGCAANNRFIGFASQPLLMTPRGPPRSPSPTTFFAGNSPPPPIKDDLDDMIVDALRHLPAPASRSEIGVWLEANYDGFDPEAHSFDLARRLRASVKKGDLSVERRYRIRGHVLETRRQLKRTSSTDRSDIQVRAARQKRRTMPGSGSDLHDQPSEMYSSDASMDEGQDDSVTPS